MILVLLLSFMSVGSSHAAGLAVGTPVQLLQDELDLPGAEIRKCGLILKGLTGKVIAGPFSDGDTAYVQWDAKTPQACRETERRSYAAVRALKVLGAPAPTEAKSKPPAKSSNCDPEKFGHSKNMEELLHKVDMADLSEAKSAEEVEKWLSCYPTPHYQQYLTKYRYQIDTAAKEFGVDGNLMKCLLVRESRWDSQLMSCTCATGLGQQTMDNIDTIGKNVGDSHQRLQSGTKAKSQMAQSWDSYVRKVKAKDASAFAGCSGNFTKSDEEKDVNSAFYKNTISHREKGCGSGAQSCRLFKQDDRRCPAASIGATAAYLGMIEKALKKALACGQIEWWQMDDSRVALALAYNAGEGTAQRALKKLEQGTLLSIGILSDANVSDAKRWEMRNHYRAIRNCMQKGNTDSPSARTPENKACFQRVYEAGPSGNSGVAR